jgi:H+-translocating NAD(P) transhydrogenase subunit alpha
MSPEWFTAAYKMLGEVIKDTDIIITTALIPGRPAPRMVSQSPPLNSFLPFPSSTF